MSETGNNHGVTNTYNKSNMLTVKQNTSGGTLCNNYSITRDYAGNATKVTDSLAGYDRRYNYDLFGRLYYETTSHNREGESEFDMEYMFDRFGNRYCELKTMHNSDDVYYREYEYGQYNQLTTIITEAISDTFVPYTISYSYDGNGNLSGSTKTIEPDEVVENKTYTFNNAGRMTQSTNNGVTTTYTYNGDGLRMSKTTNGVTTSFILDGADVVAEIKGDEITVYSRGLGLISQTKGDTTKTYFSDDHGNVTAMYSSATDGEEALYDGFGNTLFNDSSDNPFGYCGEYYDEETGLIYLRARYYDPEIGRFISEDPAMDGTNWYVYCSNNPVVFVDPSGLVSVVFYGKGMREQALCREKYYNEKYDSVTYLIAVNSAEEFVDAWNKFFNAENAETIDAVEIMCHGSITGPTGKDSYGSAYSTGFIYFGESNEKENRLFARTTTDMASGDYSVDALCNLSAKELHINACNSANPDTYNVVYGFMQRTDILYETTGFDGGAVWNADIKPYGDHDRGYGDFLSPGNIKGMVLGYSYYVKKYQPTWLKYVQKVCGLPLRERIGRRYLY